MKNKYVISAVLTAALCMLSSCANKGGETKPSDDKPVIPAVTAEFHADEAEKICSEQISRYLELLKNDKIFESLAMQYNDEIIDAIGVLSGFINDPVNELCNQYSEVYKGVTLQLVDIDSVEPITDMQYGYIEEINGRYRAVHEAVKAKGTLAESDVEELSTLYADEEAYRQYKMNFAEGYFVKCTIENVGHGRAGQRIMVYRTADSDWKIDMSVAGYIDDCIDYLLDKTASSIHKSANALIKNIKDFPQSEFVIGYDSSLDKDVPSGFNADEFRKMVIDNCEDINENSKFFMYFKEGKEFYTVYTDNDTDCGINPFGCKLVEKDGVSDYVGLELEDDSSFDGLYKFCADRLEELKK